MTACAYNPRAGKAERDPQELTGKPVWPNWQVPSSVRNPILKNMVLSLGNIFFNIALSTFLFCTSQQIWDLGEMHVWVGLLIASLYGLEWGLESPSEPSRVFLWSSVCVPPCCCLISNKPYPSSFQSPYSQFSTPHPLLRRSQHPMFWFA